MSLLWAPCHDNEINEQRIYKAPALHYKTIDYIVSNARWGRPRRPQGEGVSHMRTRERGSDDRYFCGRPLGTTSKKAYFSSCSEGKSNDEHILSWSVDRSVQIERRLGSLRVVQQIKKIGRTKAMTQSEILCCRGAIKQHIQHIAGDMAKFWDCYWSKWWFYSIAYSFTMCLHVWVT